MEIRKREAKVFLIKMQIEDAEDEIQRKENSVDTLELSQEIAHLEKNMVQQKEQI